MIDDHRIKLIAERKGFEAQTHKLVEEMAELTVAIHHLNRTDNPQQRRADFIEELGDVMIIASQLRCLLSPPERIKLSESIDFKIDRELNRIRKDKNHAVAKAE